MSKFQEYLEAIQKRSDLISTVMTNRAKKGQCMTCGAKATYKSDDGKQMSCDACMADVDHKTLKKIGE